MRTCPYCGSQMSDSDPFCTHCGAIVKDQAPRTQQEAQQTYQQPYRPQQYYSGGGRPKKNSTPIIIAVVVILLVAFAMVWALSSFSTDDSGGTDHKMTYNWSYYTDDSNSISYTYTLTVPGSYYDKVKTTTIDRTGSESDVHLSTSKGTVYAVSEYIVVDQYITKVATDLRAIYDADRAASKIPASSDFASFIMAFVQGSITYQTDSDYTNGSYSDYWKYPIETLCDKRGDCEDTSILTAALLDASDKSSTAEGKYSAGIFLIPGHAMGAVNASDVSESRVENNIRFGYYPLESTADDNKKYKVGSIAGEYDKDYFHLYTGYVTNYYGVTF